jgi:hypothetical protein
MEHALLTTIAPASSRIRLFNGQYKQLRSVRLVGFRVEICFAGMAAKADSVGDFENS